MAKASVGKHQRANAASKPTVRILAKRGYLSSKKEPKAEMSAILKRGLGDPVDKAFALEYFRLQNIDRYPPIDIKIEKDNGRYATKCFWTKRSPDQLEWTPEWIKEPSDKVKFHNAMRLEIQPQIDEFKNSKATERTGDPQNYDVDHKDPTFQDMLDLFISDCCKGKLPSFAYDKDAKANKLVDRSVASNWYQYHQNEAVLQLLTKEQHMKKSAQDAAARASKRAKTN